MKKRNKFSLSHYKLLSANMGYLVPIQVTEVLPGDTIQMATSLFVRLAPMVAPVMHPVHVRVHHWYVPFRLIWDDFEDFITGGPDGLDVSVPPYWLSANDDPTGSLYDYLGLPCHDGPARQGMKYSTLPFRAYQLIWNEWYRDQDLQAPVEFSHASGKEATPGPIHALRKVDWERDYFTTARPWPQKGINVTVPVSGATIAPPTVGVDIVSDGSNGPKFKVGQATTGPGHIGFVPDTSGSVNMWYEKSLSSNVHDQLVWDDNGIGLKANVNYTPGSSTFGHVDINDLREAFALQRFEEHRAMYGSRYVEYLRFLGIKASDARLQRPEYLGGGKQTIQFSEVVQTDPTSNSPAGSLTGHGIGAMRTNRFRRFFEENGLIISLMMVQPIAIYQQGLPRMFQREVKEDYFQRELQHIGQQEVYQSELYATAANAPESGEKTVFGYQNRYDEYRWHESSVAGEFRKLLNYWHMAREFDAAPVLNESFISGLPTRRIFAAQQNDHLYVMASHSIQARRMLSKFGNPI